MNTALLELPYLPNTNWLINFLNHEIILLEREENFVKSSFRNRCDIAAANGKLQLSIPLQGGRDHHQLYRDVRIDNTKKWQKIHWQSIRSAYGSTPFFEFYANRFQPFYEMEYELLFDFNYEILLTVLKVLKIERPIKFTSSFEKDPDGKLDLRNKSLASVDLRPRYYQPFEERNGFIPNLCSLDLIFNLGPVARKYLLG